MGFFAWIIFGALVGWAANLLIGGRHRSGSCLFSVVLGVVGAALGGLLYRLITGKEKTFDFDFPSFGVAAVGAIILLILFRLVTRNERRNQRKDPGNDSSSAS